MERENFKNNEEKKEEFIERETIKKLYCKSCDTLGDCLFIAKQKGFKNIPDFNLWKCGKCKTSLSEN